MACSSCSNDGACSCTSNFKLLDFGTRTMWSPGGPGANPADIVVSEASMGSIAPTLAAMQATVTVTEATSGCTLRVYYQLSADGSAWDTAQLFTIGASSMGQVGNGTSISDWINSVGNYKRYIRFGARIEQSGGNAVIAIAKVNVVIGVFVK